MVFSMKFVTTDLSDCLEDRSAFLCASSNIGSFMSSLFEGRQLYQSWISPSLSVETLPGWKQTFSLPFLFFITTNLIRLSEISILLGSTREWNWKLRNQVLNLVLMATMFWYNVGR